MSLLLLQSQISSYEEMGKMQKGKVQKKIIIIKLKTQMTLTHCGMYLDQNQEADFHLALVQSAKSKDKGENKNKEKSVLCGFFSPYVNGNHP